MLQTPAKKQHHFKRHSQNFSPQHRDLVHFSTRIRLHSTRISETSQLHFVFTYIQYIINFLNPSTLILRYRPSHRRYKNTFSFSRLRSPTYRNQPYSIYYLIYEDLYTRYSPLNSLRLRILYIQRSLSTNDLY